MALQAPYRVRYRARTRLRAAMGRIYIDALSEKNGPLVYAY